MATTITPTIVNVNTTVTTAPSVSQLQQSGAIVSTGGTTLAANAYQYCGNLAQVQALLSPALAITSISWIGGVATVTAAADLTLATGQTFRTTIAGAVPSGYNGTVTATVTGLNTFTYPLAVSPGTETTPGTYTPPDQAFVLDAATTFFAQGTGVGLYLLELGAQTSAANSITALHNWITTNSNPQVFYAYLLPTSWDANSAAALQTMTANYSSPSGQTYFFITTIAANLSTYATNKAVLTLENSPTAASTEHQMAAVFYQWLVNNPGPASALPPLAYRYLFGVTPWAQQGNVTAIQTALTGFANLVLTGAEGGISTATLFRGTTMDGEQGAFWYGVDYFRTQVKQALAAAIINGSNSNPPLLYNQAGINTLLAVANRIAANAVAYGCAQAISVTATPFYTYTQANPSDYAAGIYNGLSATLTGVSGFLTITFNLDAVAFA